VTQITDGHGAASYIGDTKTHTLEEGEHVMTWTSDRAGVVLYTVLGMLIVLSSIYIPAWGPHREQRRQRPGTCRLADVTFGRGALYEPAYALKRETKFDSALRRARKTPREASPGIGSSTDLSRLMRLRLNGSRRPGRLWTSGGHECPLSPSFGRGSDLCHLLLSVLDVILKLRASLRRGFFVSQIIQLVMAIDQTHRPSRIGLRPSEARHRRQRGSARGQMQKLSAGKFHLNLPSRFTSLDHLVGERRNLNVFGAALPDEWQAPLRRLAAVGFFLALFIGEVPAGRNMLER
jgi:hypothetical protein